MKNVSIGYKMKKICKQRKKYSIYFLDKNKSLPLTRIKMHIYVAEKAKKYSYVRK